MIGRRGSAAVLALALSACIALAAAPSATADDLVVKQSRSGICHCPGGDSYEAVTRFQAFETIEACLEADGRHPKRGQGECTPPVATDTEAAVLELRALIEGLSFRIAAQAQDAPADLSRLEAYKLCYGVVEGPSYASCASTICKSIPADMTQDFVDCFEFAEPDSYASAAVDECRGLLGIQ